MPAIMDGLKTLDGKINIYEKREKLKNFPQFYREMINGKELILYSH